MGLNTIFETALTTLLKDYNLHAFHVPVSAKAYTDYYDVVKVGSLSSFFYFFMCHTQPCIWSAWP